MAAENENISQKAAQRDVARLVNDLLYEGMDDSTFNYTRRVLDCGLDALPFLQQAKENPLGFLEQMGYPAHPKPEIESMLHTVNYCIRDILKSSLVYESSADNVKYIQETAKVFDALVVEIANLRLIGKGKLAAKLESVFTLSALICPTDLNKVIGQAKNPDTSAMLGNINDAKDAEKRKAKLAEAKKEELQERMSGSKKGAPSGKDLKPPSITNGKGILPKNGQIMKN
jgi:hypothetical protein